MLLYKLPGLASHQSFVHPHVSPHTSAAHYYSLSSHTIQIPATILAVQIISAMLAHHIQDSQCNSFLTKPNCKRPPSATRMAADILDSLRLGAVHRNYTPGLIYHHRTSDITF